MGYKIDSYYHGELRYSSAEGKLFTVPYLFANGVAFYRIASICKIMGMTSMSERDFVLVSGEKHLYSHDGRSNRMALYGNFVGLDGRLRNCRVDLRARIHILDWLWEQEQVLAPRAAVWEPELPKAEPPALENTEDLPPAYEQGAKLAKEADKQKPETKEPEKAKGHDCTCQNRPFVPTITHGQVEAASQMVEVWKAAGIDSKMIAMALNGFFPNLSLPVGAFTETDTEYYSANAIAAYVGVYSKKGNPHGGAVAAVIRRFIQPKDEDVCKLPFNQNGHSGVCTQYSAAVLAQVEDWFDKEQYPESISLDGKTYQLCYDAM